MRLYVQRRKTKKKENASFIVLDPHGDLVEKMRRFDLAKKYRDRVVYFYPLLRSGYTPCINPFDVGEFDLHQLEVYTQTISTSVSGNDTRCQTEYSYESNSNTLYLDPVTT